MPAATSSNATADDYADLIQAARPQQQSDPYADLIAAAKPQSDPYSDVIQASQRSAPLPGPSTQMTPAEMARTGMTNWEPGAVTGADPNSENNPFTGKPASDKPLVGPDAIKRALNAVGEIGTTEKQQPDPTSDAINQALADRVSGITSEKFVSTLPKYLIPGYAEAQGAEGLSQSVPALAQGIKEGDAGAITGQTLDTLMGASMLGHRLMPGAKVKEEAAKPEPPPIQRVSPETGDVFYDYGDRQPPEGQYSAPPPENPAQVNVERSTAVPEPQDVQTNIPSEPKVTEDPFLSRIANRFTQERSAQGEIGEVAPGEGFSTRDLLQRGLRMSPEEVTQHVSDVMQDSGGDPIKQAAAVRAEEARLSDLSSRLSRTAETNPSNLAAKMRADAAFNDLTDFHNGPVAKLKNNWHAQGMALQGEIPADLSTYNGLREAWLKDTGKAPPARMEPTMRRMARSVRESTAEEGATSQRLGQEIDRVTQTRKIPDPETVRNSLMERMKDMPCRL